MHFNQGHYFKNDVIKELWSVLGINKLQASPYHPQSDGLVERLNHTIPQMLSIYEAERPDYWDQWLKPPLEAYRTAEQAPTRFSPFELLYSRTPHMPAGVLFQMPPASHTESTGVSRHDKDFNKL